ncbi:hypothetical protein AQJ23_10070 [Streptomyces antibioticus]|nr:hypothetical protein AQJ23_10070 [Streptomyces antibioticus]
MSSRPAASNTAAGHSARVSGSRTTRPGPARPTAPAGVPGDHCTAAPPSEDPYPSTSRTPNRRSKAAASTAPASVPKPIRSGLSRSSSRSSVARTYCTARPTYVKYVAPYRRTSPRNPDAENRRRSATPAPAASAGAQSAITALPWNIGMQM